jgi:glycosyltransferase involved in cell wall biosynthesis
MRIIITTQKIDKNDALLGVYHEWVKSLAKYASRVDVICLEKGDSEFPNNVTVFSLGKEEKNQIKLYYFFRLLKYALHLLPRADALLVHMNHEYLLLLGPLAWVFRVKTFLFKSHRAQQRYLRIVTRFTKKIFTYTPQSFPFQTRKLFWLGPAIVSERFNTVDVLRNEPPYTLLYVGRISPIKEIERTFNVVSQLARLELPVTLQIVGAPHSRDDEEYLQKLKKNIIELNIEKYVVFMGEVRNIDLPSIYKQASFFINLSTKGGLDKTIFEALACGAIPITNQETAQQYIAVSSADLFVKNEVDAVTIIKKLVSDPRMMDAVRLELLENAKKYALDLFIKKMYLQIKGERDPDFVGIGAQRAGTSWIYANLASHPQICMGEKELHFFSRERFHTKGLGWYRAHFVDCLPGALCGEFSTSYLYSKDALDRIITNFPNSKIIVVLRNPIERAFSNYYMDIMSGAISKNTSFEQALMRDNGYIDRGKYFKHLAQFYLKNKENILVLIHEDSKNNPEKYMSSIYSFLGVDPTFRSEFLFTKINESRVPGFVMIEKIMNWGAATFRALGFAKLVWYIKRRGIAAVVRQKNTKETKVVFKSAELREKLVNEFNQDVINLSELLDRDLCREWLKK